MVHSWWGMLYTIFATVNKKEREFEESNKVKRTFILAGIQGLVLGIILCPLGVLYMLGLYISAGVSLWRLVEHDFGNAGGANLKPALQILYFLAMAQGMLFSYKAIYGGHVSRIRLAKLVAQDVTVDEELVVEYLEEMVVGCEKDPSFATGRNLATYGVDLMKAKSNEGFIAGIRVLGGAIKDYSIGRKVQARDLLTRSDSSSKIIHSLLETLGPRSPYSREVKEHAARIVALVAHGIRLEQFLQVIECLCSMLEESSQLDSRFDLYRQEYCDNKLKNYERVELLEKDELEYLIYDRESPDYPDFSLSSLTQLLVKFFQRKGETTGSDERKERRRVNTVHGLDGLLTEAVNIIHQLAFDEENRRIMSKTMLRHKIAMAPLRLHRDNHDASQNSELLMLEKCWVLTECFVAAVKEKQSRQVILEDGWGTCSFSLPIQPATFSGEGGGRRSGERIEEEVEEGEEERLLRSTVGSALRNAVKNIFDCLDCRAMQKKQGIQILLHLSLDMSFFMDSESRRRRLTWILLLIFCSTDDSKSWMISGFTDRDDFSSIKRLAGEKLSDMLREKHELPSEECARHLQSSHLALGDLTSALADDAEDISTRTHATIIIQGLCVYYDPFTDLGKKVEGTLVDVIPNVVKEIQIHCASTGEGQAKDPDVEKGVSKDDVLESSRDEERLQKALVSLCRGGFMKHDRLRPKLEEIAFKICQEQGKSFKYFKSLLV